MTSGFMDILIEEQTSQRIGPICSVCEAIKALPEADLRDFEAACADRRFTAKAIMRALKRKDITVTEHTLQRHRRGECSGRRG